jgi:F0F1-type ATP synthase membrane subunit a
MIKNLFTSFKNSPSALLILFLYVFFSPVVCGQIPQGIPKEMGPVDFSSTSNIIIYIVLPIIVLIAFFFWRASVKRRKKENEEDI